MKLGDFEIDNIYNLNCYNAIKQIPDKSIDLIVTDPPYFIENTIAGGNSELAKSIQKMNNELSQNNLTKSISINLLDEFIRIMKRINCYTWCNHKQIPIYLDFFCKKHKCNFDILIWNKTNATPLFHNKYLTDKEYCLYFRGGAYCNPKDYAKAKTVYCQPINMKDKNKFKHPTIKPLNIIQTLIDNSSKQNEIVLDPFAGSGTTLIASKNLQRHFIGFEINKKWYEVALNRLNKIESDGQMNMFLN